MRDGPIVKKSIEFSVSIFNYCDFLNSKRQFVIANQLLKSGTSIGQMSLKLNIQKAEWTSFIK
jgi:four helix bundle protein